MASRYDHLIAAVFRSHYRTDCASFEFRRDEIETLAQELEIELPKNIGDLIYSFRYRHDLPEEIAETAPEGMHWVIEGAGRAKYRFVLRPLARIEPREHMAPTKIPDATPQIISAYALTDEQALLAKLRYNRLIDIFLGLAAYSLQNHLRTTVEGVGQIEIDELYVGVDRHGRQYVIPVQAKGPSDRIGVVQAFQDMAFCKQRFPQLICRCLAAQFMEGAKIALFELVENESAIKIQDEKHYELVPEDGFSEDDLRAYRRRTME